MATIGLPWVHGVAGGPLLPAPTYLIGVTQTVAAATELGGCGVDGGEGHWLLGQEGG